MQPSLVRQRPPCEHQPQQRSSPVQHRRKQMPSASQRRERSPLPAQEYPAFPDAGLSEGLDAHSHRSTSVHPTRVAANETDRDQALDHALVAAVDRHLRARRPRERRAAHRDDQLATSRSSPRRPGRCCGGTPRRSGRSSLRAARAPRRDQMPVSKTAFGWTMLTRTPSLPHSSAATRASCVSAAFDAE